MTDTLWSRPPACDPVTRRVTGIEAYAAGLTPWTSLTHTPPDLRPLGAWQTERDALVRAHVWWQEHQGCGVAEHMGALGDVERAVGRALAGAILTDANFFALKRLLYHGLQSIEHTQTLWDDWGDARVGDDVEQARALMTQLDPERTPTGSFRWRDGADEALAQARRATAGARRAMHARRAEVERALTQDYEGARVDVHGHLVLAPAHTERAARDARLRPHGPSWVPTDDDLADLQRDLDDAKQAQEQRLAQVRQRASALAHLRALWLQTWAARLALLDHRLAKVRLMEQVRGCWPQRRTRRALSFERARSPDLPSTAQPLDLDMDGERPVVITGPNMGGKSVLLKLVGLAQWCTAHLYPFPAQALSAWVPQALVYVGADEQGAQAQGLSAFGREVRRIVDALEGAPAEVCWLFDEVGRGTHPEEGDALAQALVQRVHARGDAAWAVTHFLGLARAPWAQHLQIKGLDHAALRPLAQAPLDELAGHLRQAMDYPPVHIARALGLKL